MTKLLFVTFLLLSVSAQAAEKKTPEQYWTETGLSRKEFHQLVNNKSCYASANNFHGCVNAINSLAASQENPTMLIASSLVADPAFSFSGVIKDFGKFSFAAITKKNNQPSSESFRAVWQKDLAKRDRANAAIKSIFLESEKSPLNFQAILSYIEAEVLKDRNKEAATIAAAITAFLQESLDPHTHLDAAAAVKDSVSDPSQNFIGIGATLQLLNGKTVVIAPVENSPALKAGVRANDIISKVDGAETEGKKLDDVVKKIRGEVGSKVVITILRAGKEIELTIVRAKIVTENITVKTVEHAGQKVGVIKLRNFMDNLACIGIETEIQDLEDNGARGLILDLRSNGGGLLTQSVCLGGLFVGREVIVKVKDLQSDDMRELVSEENAVTKLPMVVLIDSGSASASEILSGALQDHQRAWILGERSFGKATVQAPSSFMGNSEIMMYKTVQRFYQPSGRTNQIVGILPDFEVPSKPNATEDDRFSLREGDIYPNAFEALGSPWKETRPKQVARIQECMAKKGVAQSLFEKGQNDAILPDYQVLAAEDLLKCAN